MKLVASLSALICVVSFAAVADTSFYGGYHDGYPRTHRDADYYRLERNVRDLKRQQSRQLNQCQADLRRQQQEYMQLISRQQSLGANVDSLRNENASLSDSSAKPIGPSQAEYDDLEERYETLLTAYRALEREDR